MRSDHLEASEAQLIRKARNGDADAFAALLGQHERFVYNLAFRTLNNADDASDVAQEAFLRAWLALPNFREQSRLRTWLYRIVLNLCLNRFPRLRRDLRNLAEDETTAIPEMDAAESDPAARAEQSERHTLVHREIDRLPVQYRVLISLRYQDGLSYDEIADVMSLPVGTVKTGLFRAKSRLREALAFDLEETS